MPKFAIIFGTLLIALGLVAYLGSGLSSEKPSGDDSNTSSDTDPGTPGKKSSAITGLVIPASFGVLLLVCGVVGLKETARKHAMHGAAMVGTLGALLTIGKGSFDLYKLATQQELNLRAMTFVWLMAIVCAIFVGLCIKSFRDARKRQ